MNSTDVVAKVRYLDSSWRDRDEVPRISDRDSRRAVTQVRHVTIHDARAWPQPLQLDVNGVQIFQHTPTQIADFHDKQLVSEQYYPELQDLLQKVTGADEVYVSQHLVRTEDTSDFNTAYARFLHCDYSMEAGYTSSFNLLKRRGRNPDDYENADFAWFNSWQPIQNVAYKNPLALIDPSTLPADDIVDYEYGGNNLAGKSSMPTWNPAHRLFYFSNMTPDELLFFKQLDTRTEHAKVAPHTSFDLPFSDPEQPPRRSIEVRLMGVFRND